MTSVSTVKWVYLAREGNAQMRDLLGGKGAGLAEMTNVGLPVPPSFTITTEACRQYWTLGEQFPPGLWEQVQQGMRVLEQETGRQFGDPQRPLLVSVRSGAKFSMPGMMDTVLNLGLNQATLKGLIEDSGNERFAYDAYRRFIQMFSKVVLGMDAELFENILEDFKHRHGAATDAELNAAALKEMATEFLKLVEEKTGHEFPQDPWQQLEMAVRAVFASWNNKRAVDYRNFNKIPHDLGTAINIQVMVFGNLGEDSATGVAFTRDPATGENVLYGEYLLNAQGEDVVAGIRTPQKIASLGGELPSAYHELVETARRLETHYRDAQDLEFTIQQSKLYMLQTRTAKRTAPAAVKMAVDMVREGLITKEEALQRVEPAQIYQLLLPRFDEMAKEATRSQGNLLATGLNASPGAATGKAVFTADHAQELGQRGEAVILVRPETNPDDVHGMLVARGVLTARGGATSHAAVVARGLGKPCVAGCEALKVDPEARQFSVDGRVVKEHEEISIDGTTGEVFLGAIPTIEPRFSEERDLVKLLSWANEAKRLGVWANADYPRDAARALEFGAEGIGLCRTEHMFFEEERLPVVRQMILAAAEATRLRQELDQTRAEAEVANQGQQTAAQARLAEARSRYDASKAVKDYFGSLEVLQNIQKEDFKGLLRVMRGKPVVIRLLDPPLHEFLPSHEEMLVEVTELRLRGDSPKELAKKEALLAAVAAMKEANPMLGLRGCRLGLLYPAINEMQVRAILGAAAELAQEGVEVHPEIMIPLVGHSEELRVIRQQLEAVAQEVEREAGQTIPYKFGTMIEVPRAALCADEIAVYAEFFSFGTNDLTQTTYGYSRDDAEGKFLLQYVQRGILPENPFQVLDQSGVGKLVKMGVELGRQARPDLKVGICGEHGGDPQSIAFFHQAGLDYVSCSPFRVPIARLAAAQAALAGVERDR